MVTPSGTEHPRARGENDPFGAVPPRRAGTSPRTRGKLQVGAWGEVLGGEHPRARGENLIEWPRKALSCGTSPRTRGKRFTINYRLVNCAEHPRARGENAVPIRVVICHIGTSPRTRGKPRHLFRGGEITRNIPAHAGKTEPRPAGHIQNQEHPRARGENCVVSGLCLLLAGTSPRTRGKRRAYRLVFRWRRNIPAHAGKTITMVSSAPLNGEHPRARGENLRTLKRTHRPQGTSPRTRGKRHRVAHFFAQ